MESFAAGAQIRRSPPRAKRSEPSPAPSRGTASSTTEVLLPQLWRAVPGGEVSPEGSGGPSERFARGGAELQRGDSRRTLRRRLASEEGPPDPSDAKPRP